MTDLNREIITSDGAGTRAARDVKSLEDRQRIPDNLIGRPSFLRRHEQVLLPVATFVLLIVGWQLLRYVLDISPVFISYPVDIARALGDWSQSTLWSDLAVSGREFFYGLGLALIGVPLGMVVGSSRVLRIAIDPLANALNSTPMLALTPLVVIWFGIGITSKVFVVFIMAVLPLFINTVEGVNTVDRELLRAVRSFGAKTIQSYRDVVLPGIAPFLVSGLRLAIGHAVIGVVIGEFIASTEGVGYRINASAQVFRTDMYLAGVVLIVAIAVIFNFLLKYVEKRLSPWRF